MNTASRLYLLWRDHKLNCKEKGLPCLDFGDYAYIMKKVLNLNVSNEDIKSLERYLGDLK